MPVIISFISVPSPMISVILLIWVIHSWIFRTRWRWTVSKFSHLVSATIIPWWISSFLIVFSSVPSPIMVAVVRLRRTIHQPGNGWTPTPTPVPVVVHMCLPTVVTKVLYKIRKIVCTPVRNWPVSLSLIRPIQLLLFWTPLPLLIPSPVVKLLLMAVTMQMTSEFQ